MKKNSIIAELEKIVGPRWVRTGGLAGLYYGSDVLTHLADGAIYPENHPRAVVMPGSAGEIRRIVMLAARRRVPLYAVGGGTILLIGSMPDRPDFAISLDFHRMQKVEVDRERMVLRVEPGATGLQVSQYVRNMNLGYRPYFGGSPPASLFVAYQVFTGQNKMAGYHDGMGINNVTGLEMVLSTGEVIRTGSMLYPGAPGWSHGPGPALTFLPFFANGGYGIVTAMEFRLFATPEEVRSLWVFFDELEDAVSGIYKIMRSEYGCGATVMGPGCWTHCSYSSRHWQEGAHFIKGTQNVSAIGMAFRGSPKKVRYERQACIKILEKYRGRVVPDWMVAVLDGHETNAQGWQASNSAKICSTYSGKSSSGGIYVSGGVFDSTEKLAQYMKRGMDLYCKISRENPEFLNHVHPVIRLAGSCGQEYLSMGGHANGAGEVIFIVDFTQKQFLPVVGRIKQAFEGLMHEIGLAPLGVGRDVRTWTECGDHFSMARIIKKAADPLGIMSAGCAFPPDVN